MAPDAGGPAPPAVQDDDVAAEGAQAPLEEGRLGGSPAAKAANAALLALTRAARSFTLYDPANKVVRALIAELSFRLFRDGVRKMAFAADSTWDEVPLLHSLP